MQAFHKIDAVFDDPNLIGVGGSGPGDAAGRTGRPAASCSAERLSVASPNAAVKAAGVIAGMLAGADSHR